MCVGLKEGRYVKQEAKGWAGLGWAGLGLAALERKS